MENLIEGDDSFEDFLVNEDSTLSNFLEEENVSFEEGIKDY